MDDKRDNRSTDAPQTSLVLAQSSTLVDAVDRLLNRGAVLAGEATISLAGVDLIYLGLNLVVASVETLRQPSTRLVSSAEKGEGSGEEGKGLPSLSPAHPSPPSLRPIEQDAGTRPPLRTRQRHVYTDGRCSTEEGTSASAAYSTSPPTSDRPPSSSPRGTAGADQRSGSEAAPGAAGDTARDLARLVLALVELLRQLLERQAMRRMDGGGLSDDEVERMGLALQELEAKLAELRTVFGLSEEDLNVDLGPLGRLL